MNFDPLRANPQRDVVDLRSDTVTRPTAEMYQAMLDAPLGDDVLGDDPTVELLESQAAKLLGKEAALFVTSGTMGNQLAVLTQTQRGDAILADEDAHIVYYECGALGAVGGVVSWTLPTERGTLAPETVAKYLQRPTLHTPGTVLLSIENTHNRAGGTITPPNVLADYRQLADRHGFKMHLDGARIFNASVALGVPVSDLASPFDSVTFCMSKGLGAPVGSIFAGKRELVDRARQWRKRLGGGMRQSGLLAACGIVALNSQIERLAEDHRRAGRLADGIAGLPGYELDRSRVQTNMVLLETHALAEEWVEALRAEGIWSLTMGDRLLRLVLHHDIDDAQVDRAIEAFRRCSQGPLGR